MASVEQGERDARGRRAPRVRARGAGHRPVGRRSSPACRWSRARASSWRSPLRAGLIRHKLIEAAYMDAVAAGRRGPRAWPWWSSRRSTATRCSWARAASGSGFEPTRSRGRDAGDARARRALRARRCASCRVTRSWCGFRPWLPDGLPAVGAARRRHMDEHRPRGRGRLHRPDLGPAAGSDDLRRAAGPRPGAVRPAPIQRGAAFWISMTCWNVGRLIQWISGWLIAPTGRWRTAS